MGRQLSKDFLDAMREKLAKGHGKGMIGWEQHWEDCSFNREPCGWQGDFIQRLRGEVAELTMALFSGDKEKIRRECADVANFAMFIADIHEALK